MVYTDEQHELIVAAQAGDENALARLVQLHASDVYRFLLHLCGNQALAEDLSQETFLRALPAIQKYEFRAPFRAWLFRIAVNLLRDDRRRRLPDREGWPSPESVVSAAPLCGAASCWAESLSRPESLPRVGA